ncbi:MAG: hypothetical protein HYZ25_00340 [Chloroflexi bacterium]|nr:hypothetical protein [Chloroflexota bacterium]
MVGTLFFFLFFILVIGMIMLANSIKIVPEHRRLDVYRLGRYIGEKGPGVVLIIPIIDRGMMKDLGESPLHEQTPSRRLVGVVGQTESTVYTEGKVRLSTGEVWDAVSQRPISTGQRVRVVRTILEVEEERA